MLSRGYHRRIAPLCHDSNLTALQRSRSSYHRARRRNLVLRSPRCDATWRVSRVSIRALFRRCARVEKCSITHSNAAVGPGLPGSSDPMSAHVRRGGNVSVADEAVHLRAGGFDPSRGCTRALSRRCSGYRNHRKRDPGRAYQDLVSPRHPEPRAQAGGGVRAGAMDDHARLAGPEEAFGAGVRGPAGHAAHGR